MYVVINYFQDMKAIKVQSFQFIIRKPTKMSFVLVVDNNRQYLMILKEYPFIIRGICI